MNILREKVMALSDEDLARLVLITAHALNDQQWTAEIAELCDIPKEELEAWSDRVVWTDDLDTSLYGAVVQQACDDERMRAEAMPLQNGCYWYLGVTRPCTKCTTGVVTMTIPNQLRICKACVEKSR